jgi:catechol 2,3-dioxygenase-like lactoylglutathione lyase family enzyme
MRVVELDHIVLLVSDVERSLAFYSGTLGLSAERVERWRAGEVGFPSVRVNADTIIDLVKAPARDGARQPNLAHFCLVTDTEGLDGAIQELASAGVSVKKGPGRRSGARGDAMSIYFDDPDGNEIELRTYAGLSPA